MIGTAERNLRGAGFVRGASGSVLLSGPAARLFDAWVRYLKGRFDASCDECVDAPAFIATDVLEQAGYVQNFPQQLMRCDAHGGAAGHFMTPAACFHVYPRVADHGERDLTTVRVASLCARRESGAWRPPFRLSAFHMFEVVHIGGERTVVARRDAILPEIADLFAAAGIQGRFEVATDAFFLGEGEGARVIQKLKGLKREFTVEVDGEQVALASVNLHEDYFGTRFDLRDRDARTAWTFCAAFGIERMTAMGLLVWGASRADWPEVLRT